jgi:hypothetical protein
MSGIPSGLSGLLMILALTGTIAMSGTFFFFAWRAPTRQGKVTCAVLALMSLLPIAFLAMLITAVQD